jgi:hypothetical protein
MVGLKWDDLFLIDNNDTSLLGTQPTASITMAWESKPIFADTKDGKMSIGPHIGLNFSYI